VPCSNEAKQLQYAPGLQLRERYVLLASDVFGNTEYNAPYGSSTARYSYAINCRFNR